MYRRKKYYVLQQAGKPWELFYLADEPTFATHGHIDGAFIGPFRTKMGAEYMRQYGNNNPHCRCVAEAEKLAKKMAIDMDIVYAGLWP